MKYHTSRFQTHVTFLFVNENIKWWYSFSYLENKEHLSTKIKADLVKVLFTLGDRKVCIKMLSFL